VRHEEPQKFDVPSLDLREFSKLVLHLLHKAAMRQREQQEIDGTTVNYDGQNGTEELVTRIERWQQGRER